MESIIKSILDSDLYKFSMMNAILQKFPNLWVKYSFTDRNNTVYPKGFYYAVKTKLNHMKDLVLSGEEENFLINEVKFLPHAYIDFLKGYKFDPNEVTVTQDIEGHLHIEIEGYWFRTVLWEVPILSIVSELYYYMTMGAEDHLAFQWKLNDSNLYDEKKLREMISHNAFFSDFGTRRRFSYENQKRIVGLFAEDPCFVGTSNVHLAQLLGVKAIGTMAHEWIMAHGALFGYRMANKLALDNWVDVYGGSLGIALSDTYTTDSFLKSFDMRLAKLFDGVRQDSGDPIEFTDKVIDHYKKMGIDPMSKVIVFSDSLNIEKACNIKEYCVGKIKSSFGIGTHLTNDVGVKPMNIVIKLSGVKVNDELIPCVKLSDDKGKNMGDRKEIDLCKGMLRLMSYE
jgi:nicotinate phosphoribosyltransferase